MAAKKRKEGEQFTGILRVVDALLRGESLDTGGIVAVAKVSESQARKYAKYIKDHVTGVKDGSDGLCVSAELLTEPASREAVVGASLMSGMAQLFEGTKYANGMRETLSSIVARAAQPSTTEEYARKFMFAVRGGDPAIENNPGRLELVINAILQQRKVDIDYLSFDGTPRAECVDPLTLLVYDHQLYVVARNVEGKIQKPRRFSRIRHIEVTRQRFEYPSPAEYDPRRDLAEVWGVFLGFERPLEEVVVRFSADFRTYIANHHWHPTQKLIDANKLHVRFHLRPCLEFEAWILSLGADVEVLSPVWLRESIATKIAAASKVYPRPKPRRHGQ